MDNLARKGVDTKDIAARANDPIRFTLPDRNTPASGYEATLLEDICAVVIDAHSRGALDARQAHVGERCAILHRGFARVGVIGALIDLVLSRVTTSSEKPRKNIANIIGTTVKSGKIEKRADGFYLAIPKPQGGG